MNVKTRVFSFESLKFVRFVSFYEHVEHLHRVIENFICMLDVCSCSGLRVIKLTSHLGYHVQLVKTHVVKLQNYIISLSFPRNSHHRSCLF
jgi:hypothetical protein